MSTKEFKRSVEAADGEPRNTEPNGEMARVQNEAQDKNVLVNGWQRGIEDIPDFAVVTDKATGATFAVKPGEPLADALDRVQARMTGNGTTKHEAGVDSERKKTSEPRTSERIRITTPGRQAPEQPTGRRATEKGPHEKGETLF